jgi:hypothetical protein
MAARARRLARGADPQTISALTAFADEMEAKAAALETGTFSHKGAAAVQQK